MIRLAVIEKDSDRRSILRKWLVTYTVRQDCQLDIFWVVDENPVEKVQKHAARIQIALIDLDSESSESCGKALYDANPDCRILYYRAEPCNLVPLLSSRPISFFLWAKGVDAFLETFNAVYREVLFAQTSFRYETKSRMYLLSKQSILYFQSDLRYVDIHMVQGEHPRILAKLNDVAPFAGDGFLRIHKSYLVNTRHVLWLDKKSHLVQLSNGEQLPVSEAQYDRVCEKLRTVM